jgi:hypothetical protein
MASDELRFLVGVPENYRRGALPELRRHKESFARVPTATTPRQLSSIGIFIKDKAN